MCALAAVAAAIVFSSREARAQAQQPQLTLSVTTGLPNNQVIYSMQSTYNVSGPPAPWTVSGAVTYYYRQTDTVSGVPSTWRYTTTGLS